MFDRLKRKPSETSPNHLVQEPIESSLLSKEEGGEIIENIRNTAVLDYRSSQPRTFRKSKTLTTTTNERHSKGMNKLFDGFRHKLHKQRPELKKSASVIVDQLENPSLEEERNRRNTTMNMTSQVFTNEPLTTMTIPEEGSLHLPSRESVRTTEKQRISTKTSDRTSERMSSKVLDRSSSRISERTPSKVLDRASSRISERMTSSNRPPLNRESTQVRESSMRPTGTFRETTSTVRDTTTLVEPSTTNVAYETLQQQFTDATSQLNERIENIEKQVSTVQADFASFKIEVMNEFQMFKYDMLKEMTCLKGSVTKITEYLEAEDRLEEDETPSQSQAEETTKVITPTIAVIPPYLPRTTNNNSDSTVDNQLLKKYSTASTDTCSSTHSTTQELEEEEEAFETKSPIKKVFANLQESAVSQPLSTEFLVQYFPPLPDNEQIEKLSRNVFRGTRQWILPLVTDWLQTRTSTSEQHHRYFEIYGKHGCGKSTLAAFLCTQFPTDILAYHFVHCYEQYESEPCKVILSLAHQIATNFHEYRHELLRLNIAYVVNETNPKKLLTTLLLKPLQNLSQRLLATMPEHEIMPTKVILLDGLDEIPSSKLWTLFTEAEFPEWLKFITTFEVPSNHSSTLAISLEGESKDAHQDLHQYIQHCILNEPKKKTIFNDPEDDPPITESDIIQRISEKAQGNFLYLSYIRQALYQLDTIDLDLIDELPECLEEIYDEIIEDKYGQGKRRLWGKVKPFLEVCLAAVDSGVCPISEKLVKQLFSYTREEWIMMKLSFTDIIEQTFGYYYLNHISLVKWFLAQDETSSFYINIRNGLKQLSELPPQTPMSIVIIKEKESQQRQTTTGQRTSQRVTRTSGTAVGKYVDAINNRQSTQSRQSSQIRVS